MICPIGHNPGTPACEAQSCLACLHAQSEALICEFQDKCLHTRALQRENDRLYELLAARPSNDVWPIGLPKAAVSVMFTLTFLGAFLA